MSFRRAVWQENFERPIQSLNRNFLKTGYQAQCLVCSTCAGVLTHIGNKYNFYTCRVIIGTWHDQELSCHIIVWGFCRPKGLKQACMHGTVLLWDHSQFMSERSFCKSVGRDGECWDLQKRVDAFILGKGLSHQNNCECFVMATWPYMYIQSYGYHILQVKYHFLQVNKSRQ